MIGRRGLISMLGLAPAAAVMPQQLHPANPVPSIVSTADDVSNLGWAKRRLKAIHWADVNGLPRGDAPLIEQADAIEFDVEAMRSWSPSFKRRVTQARRLQRYNENYMKDALARVEREVKLSMAPDWVRRFL